MKLRKATKWFRRLEKMNVNILVKSIKEVVIQKKGGGTFYRSTDYFNETAIIKIMLRSKRTK